MAKGGICDDEIREKEQSLEDDRQGGSGSIVSLSVKGDKGETYDCTFVEPKVSGVDGDTTTFTLLVSGINKDGNDVDINGKNIILKSSDNITKREGLCKEAQPLFFVRIRRHNSRDRSLHMSVFHRISRRL